MNGIEPPAGPAICKQVLRVVKRAKGTANTEVLQHQVVRLRSLMRKGRLREAESMAYEVMMEYQGFSDKDSDEMAEDHETSKAPRIPVKNTVDIGRSIKFVRVAAGIKQGEMANA